VLQVINATHSTNVNSSTNTYVDTGLTATITPTLATSKILVIGAVNGCAKSSNNAAMGLQLLRGATVLAKIGDYVGNTGDSVSNHVGTGAAISYLDAPNTTSATTYKVQFRSVTNNAQVTVQGDNSVSMITLLEIGA